MSYTLEELLVLGPPLEVDDGFLACDRLGCDSAAAVILPGAALCQACMEEFTDEGGYTIPQEELVGGPEWRQARDGEYRERVLSGAGYPAARVEGWDARLAALAARAVDELLEDLTATRR